MEDLLDPVEEEEIRKNLKAKIEELIARFGEDLKICITIFQYVKQVALKKALEAEAASPDKSDRRSSQRINVTELDLKILEKIIEGKHDLMEFGSSLDTLLMDMHYIKSRSISHLTPELRMALLEAEEKVKEIKALYWQV